MSKSRNYDKESKLIDRLKHENQQLKRENAKMRRQMDRLNLDHDRYRTLRELVHKQTQESRKKPQEKWQCWECGKGTMRLILMPRLDGTFYLRRCDLKECGHATKLKKHTKDVEES